ncbi:hypothetical protein K2173_007094 [Erythroxylum novogranatense]|uniref:ADP-ribosyl cyclase/cyclic ADP-ribose hydrolase n=1 Tax=Erythroxylum novogranatense TaxID=1862640 RepID=A0AAV8SZA5_9ROSI|nr:hypothetical protein K2173_007094 [Erythroxylum novogranatense]
MATQQWKHHAFISFRGEDTRDNFVCHLYDALCRKGLDTFVDNQLRTGEEINPALLQAIHDSKVAIIIFSENYASSSWCLDELLKIIECHESKTHKQIVIPVFYGVTPSDVRRQNGRYGESFAKHIENGWYKNKIQKWKGALTQAANISGWDSGVIRGDNKLIDQIVRDVLEKLELLYPCSLEDFVGLDSKICKAKELLATGSSDVRMLGICGMGGIGKTTIAGAIFDEVSSQFVGRCFVRNVREVSQEKEGILKLLQQLILDLLEERDVKIYTENVKPALRERLKSKKVFVVFDDVSDRSQLETLTGNQIWFGEGSNIIVTSRDKQVFANITDNIYEVEELSDSESRRLFMRNAHPSQDHIPLIGSFVNYARGNPLALKVLGSFVCGKGVNIWRDALKKLSKCPNPKIQNVLKLSYDGLDEEEQAIFLHIACFFKGENIDEAKRVFSSCGLSADVGVSVLVDKSLVTISEYGDMLDMHDLLQEMGRQIVRQESKDDPRGRSRLWDAEEIRHVFEENEGTEAMKTQFIILNTSQIRDDIEIDPNVFKRMLDLKVLRFYTSGLERSKLHLTERLPFLPSGLRYLHWDGYPFESLPAGFHAKQLVVLDLPNSNIKQIWEEVKGNIKVPPSSRQFFSKITSLDMSYCQNLKSFPNNVDLQSLEILSLWVCSNLEKFPDISTNLRKLDVVGAAIEEVHPSSIERLSKLEKLNMGACEKLERLPVNICKLQALQELNLGFCKSLKEFPEFLEPMDNLRTVNLDHSGIEAIPFSIDNMKGLKLLYMERCLNLACCPERFVNFMREIDRFTFSTACKQRKKPRIPNFRTRTVCEQGEKPCMVMDSEDVDYLLFEIDCRATFEAKVTIKTAAEKRVGMFVLMADVASHVSEGVSYLINLPSHPCLKFFSPYYILDLSRNGIRELPKDLGSLYYLRKLKLQYNDFVEIPASIKQLSLLESLRLDGCRKLRSLPQLPTSLCRLSAPYCESLETLLASKQPIVKGGNLDFTDCIKLEEKECEFLAYELLRNRPKNVQLRYPGNRIPEWFEHQTTGDIIRIELPSERFFNHKFFGFAFCIDSGSDIMFGYKKNVEIECYFEDKYNRTIGFTYETSFWLSKSSNFLTQQHVLVWCLPDFNVWISERRHLFGRHCMASFKFFIDWGGGKIKKCGITPLYVRGDVDEDEYDDEDDEEDMNSGDADEVCSLAEKRKATVEAGSKIKRQREASA